LVARREIKAQVRSRSFIISTVVFLVLIVAGIVVGSWLSGSLASDQASGNPTRLVIGPGVTGLDALSDPSRFSLTEVASTDQAISQVRAGTADAALVATGTGSGAPFTVVADQAAPSDLVDALTQTPPVSLLNPSPFGPLPAGYVMSLAFGILFMMVAMIFGQTIAMNTVVEKQTRVVEILLAAVPDRVLLGGKVLGNSLLALSETVLIALAAWITLQAVGDQTILSMLTTPLLWYVVFFVVGFVLLASLYAGLASLVSRIEDVGSAVMPITLVVMIPYFIVIALNSNEAAMKVLSFIPIVSTVAMPVRMIQGQGHWWEAAIALLILIAATLAAVLAGARVYSRSLLQTGKPLKFLQVLRGQG
jgi:ABC-2 type transport system permease protein